MEKIKGVEIIIKCLEKAGVDTIFGYPGGLILDIYNELDKTKIKHYMPRHEQSAVHMAEGYAKVKNQVGVVLVTSGPGATNTVTGIANAYLDSTPLVVLTGQVDISSLGKEAFQEVNITKITQHCCKKNYLIKHAKDITKTFKEAFYLANSGKKGPVVIDLAKNIFSETAEFDYDKIKIKKQIFPKCSENKLNNIIKLLTTAKKPLIISGGGVVSSNAEEELFALAKKLDIPVSTTLMGTGSFPADDKLFLGMIGHFGNYWTNYAFNNADIILAVGCRFNNKLTDFTNTKAKIILIDVNKNHKLQTIKSEISVTNDAKEILAKLNKKIKDKTVYNNKIWLEEIEQLKGKRFIPEIKTEKLNTMKFLQKAAEFLKTYNPIVSTEVGQHQIWAANTFNFIKSRKFLTSGGLGTMGFGFPAAMGAYIADEHSHNIVISGDGSVQMSINELATCMEYKIPLKIIILNNGYLGMVRQTQETFFNNNFKYLEISSPDFVKVAQSYGAKGFRIEKEAEIVPILQKMIDCKETVFVEVIVEGLDKLYPYKMRD